MRALRQAALGLAHCHSYGVFHLDVKADNMLVRHNSALALCIADFGFSAVNVRGGLTERKYGTTFYSAPEVSQS